MGTTYSTQCYTHAVSHNNHPTPKLSQMDPNTQKILPIYRNKETVTRPYTVNIRYGLHFLLSAHDSNSSSLQVRRWQGEDKRERGRAKREKQGACIKQTTEP